MLASLTRTIVPFVVGYLLSIPVVAHSGLTADQVTGPATVALGSGYYLAARLLEQYVRPRFGWLLGYAKAPAYAVKSSGAHTVAAVSGPFHPDALNTLPVEPVVQLFPPATP